MTWRKIQNTNYSVNEHGDVRNDTTGTLKKPTVSNQGYFVVDLYTGNVCHKRTVHRLVAEAFLPNPERKPTVDHKNGVRTDNDVANLRWATYSEQNSRFGTVGGRSEPITVMRTTGEILKFDRIKDAAAYFHCCVGNISQMLQKGTYGKRGRTRYYKFAYSAGGFRKCIDYRKGNEPSRVPPSGGKRKGP